MSWRLLPALTCLVVACGGGSMKVKKGEPQTAREKMRAEEKAKQKHGSIDDDAKPPGSKKWTGWRYQGDRDECFFLVGKKCFKSEKAACNAAKCGDAEDCETEGAGPATVRCKKPR